MIRFTNVNKYFGQKLALNEVCFEVSKGEYCAIIGNNGAGKSTIINVMLGLKKKDSGKIELFGKDQVPGNYDYRNRIGAILSFPYYIEDLSLREYVKFYCKFQKCEFNQKHFDNYCELLDLEQVELIQNFSSGNKMKVSILLSLYHKPEMLIYDEPFTNLDVKTSTKLKDLLMSFKGDKTLFISSHNLNFVSDICDKFLILNRGKMINCLYLKDFKNGEELKNKLIYELST